MSNKKSQMEIVGLAIVVILITLALTFVVRFVILDKPIEIKRDYSNTQLASNMINTFIDTTSEDCRGLSMTELLQDCASGGEIRCGSTPSCVYVNDAATSIFQNTLGAWNTAYNLSIYRKLDPTTFMIALGEGCPLGRESEPFAIPTQSPSNPLIVQLDICN